MSNKSHLKKKSIKNYYCPYCGKRFNNSQWTYDHIIPLGMGGPKQFKILSCFDCNHKISIIEQRAIFAPSIRKRIISLGMEGHQILRRRRTELPFNRLVGESGGKPVKLFYKPGDDHLSLVFFGGFPHDLTPDEYIKQFQHGQAIIPIDKESTDEYKALLSLVNKILLGCGHWLWGEKFSDSEMGANLRKGSLEIDLDRCTELNSIDRHAVWDTSQEEDLKDSEISEYDALDNSPDTTINFHEDDGIYYGLINIFGDFESMVRLGEKKAIDLFDDQNTGIIIIAGSTKNQIKSMTIKEYEEYKIKQFVDRNLLTTDD